MKIKEDLENSVDIEDKGKNYHPAFDLPRQDGKLEGEFLVVIYNNDELNREDYQLDVYQVENTDEGEKITKVEEDEILEEVKGYIGESLGHPENYIDVSGDRYRDPNELTKRPSDFKDVTDEDFDPEFEKIMEVAEDSKVHVMPLPTRVMSDNNGNIKIQDLKGATDGYKNIFLDYFSEMSEMAKTFYHEIAHNLYGNSEETAERKSEKWYQKYGDSILSALNPSYRTKRSYAFA